MPTEDGTCIYLVGCVSLDGGNLLVRIFLFSLHFSDVHWIEIKLAPTDSRRPRWLVRTVHSMEDIEALGQHLLVDFDKKLCRFVVIEGEGNDGKLYPVDGTARFLIVTYNSSLSLRVGF